MKWRKNHILMFFFFVSSIQLIAQEWENRVELRAKSTGSEILIRWAPSSPIVWHYANEYGYTLEKVTLLENGKVLLRPKHEIIGVFKPAPLPEWAEIVKTDDYSAVAAQSIYGENFSVNESFSSDLVKVINQSKALENRFSFALFASDISIEAAELSGLYYRDEAVSDDFQYLYRVYPNIAQESLSVDTASVLIGLKDETELPIIQDFTAQFSDQIVELSWGTIWGADYSGYWIEKSSDGNYFKSISEVPIVNTFNEGKQSIITYDSLVTNDIEFFYRVVGLDYFGQKGPPSAIVSGVGRPDFNYAPSITGVDEVANGLRISWEMPKEAVGLTSSFELLRQDPNGHHLEVIRSDLDGKLREALDLSPKSSNYYVIKANDQYGNSTQSFPFFHQIEDSIPPGSPKNLNGWIDTLGHVHLKWNHNEEEHLYGYKLYVSNFPDGDFTQVPGPIIVENQFLDQVELTSLTEEIYYQIKAFDTRFNPSEPSEILRLEKPDLIPPMPPVFTKVKSDSLGVHLWWESSPSADVTNYFLYRRSKDEEDWTQIEHFDASDTTNYYLDSDINQQNLYAYTLLALDDDNLESKPSEPVTVKAISTPRQFFTDLFSEIDEGKLQVNISWNSTGSRVKSYHIYRGKNGLPISLLKIISGSENEFQDSFNSSDEYSEYHLMAVFNDGSSSAFSRKIKVEF